jgi:hypothetical protein
MYLRAPGWYQAYWIPAFARMTVECGFGAKTAAGPQRLAWPAAHGLAAAHGLIEAQ